VRQTKAERRFVRLAGSMNSKAARLGREGRISAGDLAAAFLASDWTCPYCGTGIDPLHCSFDHVVPFDKGGTNRPEDILACCLTCQRSKGVKTLDQYEFAQTLRSEGAECEVCGKPYIPRWADWMRGYGRTCSRICAGKKGGETTKTPAPLDRDPK